MRNAFRLIFTYWIKVLLAEKEEKELLAIREMLKVFKGLNRNVFDPYRQMLRRRCLFKTDLSWQVVWPRWLFVPNPALMSWLRGGIAKRGSLSFTKRRGKKFGNRARTRNAYITTNAPGWVPGKKKTHLPSLTTEMTGVARRWAPVTWWWCHWQPIVGMWRRMLQCWIFIAQSHASLDQWKCTLPYACKPPWCTSHQPLSRTSSYCSHPLGQWGCRARRKTLHVLCTYICFDMQQGFDFFFVFSFKTWNLNPSS